MNSSSLQQAPVENLTREINLDLGVGTYLIQTRWKNVTRTLKWDAKTRLALDHPASFFLIKDNKKAIIHVAHDNPDIDDKYEILISLPDPVSSTKADTWHEVPNVQGHPLRFRIARVERARAAYLPMISGSTAAFPLDVALYASCGVHGFLSAFERLTHNGTFSGQIAQHQAFTLRRTSRAAYVRSKLPGVIIKLKGKPSFNLPPSQKITLSNEDLQSAKISLGEYWWRFNRLPTPVFTHLEVIDERDEEFTFFKKCASLLAVASLLVLGLSQLVLKSPRKTQDLLLDATSIQLKKPKQLAVRPSPLPKPVPKLEPIPKPTQTPIVLKPQELKAPPKKVEPKPQAPKKQIAKTPAKKPVEKQIERPREKPKKQTLIAKAAPSKPLPAPPAPRVPAPPAPVAPVAPPAPPPGPTVAQIKEAQAAQARAQLAKSLGFLATTPSKNAPARSVSGESTGTAPSDATYAAMGKAANGAHNGSTNALSSLAKNAGNGAGGPISTRSSRSIASDAGVSRGRGKGLNEVQGKVTLAALYNPNGGSDLGNALSGGAGVSVSGKGSLEESQLLKTLSKYLQRFQYCYEKALLTNATLAGTLSMEWVIQENGKAQMIKVVRSELNHAPLHQCVSGELAKIAFPAPKGGSVTVKYPFAFSSSSI